MRELTYPVELRDQELDLVAAGGSTGGGNCCGGDNSNRQALVYLEDVNILSGNNIAVASVGKQSSRL